MDRFLVDASAIIALARIGELHFFAEASGPLYITAEVAGELAVEGRPDVALMTSLMKLGRIATIDAHERFRTSATVGIGPGEASLLDAWRPGDTLVIDDRNARALAKARSIPHTGLLGLLAVAVETRRVAPARGLEILEKLSRSDFRMTVDLYGRTRAAIEQGARHE